MLFLIRILLKYHSSHSDDILRSVWAVVWQCGSLFSILSSTCSADWWVRCGWNFLSRSDSIKHSHWTQREREREDSRRSFTARSDFEWDLELTGGPSEHSWSTELQRSSTVYSLQWICWDTRLLSDNMSNIILSHHTLKNTSKHQNISIHTYY